MTNMMVNIRPLYFIHITQHSFDI